MSINFKKILLAGTALVAVAAFGTQAQAAAAVATASGQQWASAGTRGSTGTLADAASGDALQLGVGAYVSNITNTGTPAADTAGVFNTFTVGAITGATAGSALNIVTGTANDLTVNVASFAKTMSIVADTINNTAFPTAAVNVVDAGVWTSGASGTTIVNSDTTTAKAVSLTVGGNYQTVLATALTAGSFVGANTTLTLNGATNSDVATTLTDTAGGTGGISTLVLGGTAAQTFSGTIAGGAAHEGVLTVSNTGGTALTGAVSNLRTINAGAGVAGTVTSFSTTVGTDNENLTGLGTITNTGALTATNLNLNAAGVVNLNAAGVNAITNTVYNADGTVSVGAGGTLTSTVTTATTNTGTLTFAAAGTMTGAVGTAALQLKTINAGAGAVSFSGLTNATTLAFNGAGGTVSLNGVGTNTIGTVAFGANNGTLSLATTANLTGNVTTTTTNQGTLTLAGASTVTGTVGATGLLLTAVNAGAGAATFTGDINATTTTITGANTVALQGNLTGTTLAFAGSGGTVTLADGKNITAATTTSANTSTLTLLGSSTVTGTVGSGAAGAGTSLLAVNAGAAGKADVFTAAMTTSTLAVGSGTVALNGATTGALVFNALSTGTVTVADTMNFTGAMGGTGGVAGAGIGNVVLSGTTGGITTIGASGVLKSLTLAGGSSTVQKTDTVGVGAGAVLAADTTTLNGNILAAGGTFALGAGQTLNSTIYGPGATNYGQVVTAAAATLTATSVVNLTNASTAFIPNATAFHILNGAASTNNLGVGMLEVNGVVSTGLAGAQVVNAGIMTYTETAGANDLVITATRANPATVALTGNGTNAGTVFNQANLAGGADMVGNILAFQGNLQNAASAGAVTSLLSSVAPTVDGSSAVTALDVGSAVQGLADTRIASLRSGDALSGVAAGSSANGWNMWLQGYGQHGQQDTKDLISGYKADTWGGAVGVDSSNMISNGILGVSFNYGYTTADSSNANTTATKVDNYGFNLYGGYDLGQQYFLNGQLGYAYNKITDDRHNVGGIAGVTAHGDTNSDQYMAKIAVGRDFAQDRGLTLTPTVSAAYTHLHTKGFTETGAAALDNIVGSSDLNDLKLAVGVNAGWNYKNTDGSTLKPAVHVGYAYDALNDRVDVSSSIVGDTTATAFTTEGPSPDRSSFNAGAGIVYATTANWDLSANYDYTYKSHYDSHTGVIRATSHF